MKVEVALVRVDGCCLQTVDVDVNATVADALAASRFRSEDFAVLAVFGELVDVDRPLREGERLDLLPALPMDPMAARRKRALGTEPAPVIR